MENNGKVIGGVCEMYVCYVCRTKYGYKHQKWCTQKNVSQPECQQCIYYIKRVRCEHPTVKKEGRTV